MTYRATMSSHDLHDLIDNLGVVVGGVVDDGHHQRRQEIQRCGGGALHDQPARRKNLPPELVLRDADETVGPARQPVFEINQAISQPVFEINQVISQPVFEPIQGR